MRSLQILNKLFLFVSVGFLAGCDSSTEGLPASEDAQTPASQAPSRPPATDPDAWTLVFADEFDYVGLPNPEFFDYEVGRVRNNEEQYYTVGRLENARVEDGNLVIEARKEDYEGARFTSASVITKNKVSWRYGRIEIRAKLDSGRGTWMAFWGMGVRFPETPWPLVGEMDILESVGFKPNEVQSTVQTEKYNYTNNTDKKFTTSVPTLYTDFHIFAVEWFEDRMDFYIDDNKHFTFANDRTGVEGWPFFEDQYVILSNSVGGDYGGIEGVDEDIWPRRFTIDYLRVYQRNAAAGAANPNGNTL